MSLSVSVVIPTYNRATYLPLCLEALRYQTHLPQEVIVVDASPNKATEAIIRERYAFVQYVGVSAEQASPSLQRNIGLSCAQGNIVAFLDDDAIPQAHWIASLAEGYNDLTVGGVGGRVIERLGPDIAADHCEDGCISIGRIDRKRYWIRANFSSSPPAPVDVEWLRGCNFSFRRELINMIGSFDPQYMADPSWEDTDLCLRVRRQGYRILYHPDAVVFHLSAPRPRFLRTGQDRRSKMARERNRTYYMLKEFGFAHIVVRFLLKESYWALLRRDFDFFWSIWPRSVAIGLYCRRRLATAFRPGVQP